MYIPLYVSSLCVYVSLCPLSPSIFLLGVVCSARSVSSSPLHCIVLSLVLFAKEYLRYLGDEGGYYATAIMFPYRNQAMGISGVFASVVWIPE